MTHKEQIELDIKLFGLAYEVQIPGTGELIRIDPRIIRCVKPNKPCKRESDWYTIQTVNGPVIKWHDDAK